MAYEFMIDHAIVNKSKIGMLGASFGGNVALLSVSHLQEVKVLALKSPVCFYPDSFIAEFGQEKIDEWENSQYLDEIGFDYSFYLDSFDYNTYYEAKKITCSCIITHGQADEIVPISQSRHLKKVLVKSPLVKLVEYQGVNHRYSNEGAWDNMANDIVNFIESNIH